MKIRATLASALLCLLLLPGLAQADDTKDALKAFKSGLRAERWQDRRDAYLTIADYDSGPIVKAILDAIGKETNPAVQLAALDVLGGFESSTAQTALVAEVRKARGPRRMHVLMTLARQKGDTAVPILLEIVQGKDGPAAAQAALALGRKEVEGAVPHLLVLLRHKDWQVRRAGAMALSAIAQPPPPKPKKGQKPPPKDFRWPTPHFLETPEVTQALITALGVAKGVDRQAVIETLRQIHNQDLGDNVLAWKAVAAGKPVDERTLRKRIHPPAAFGIPLYGQRIVLIYDNSLRSGDPHRFGTGDRLLEVCKVPGGPPLIPNRLVTVGQFGRAHLRRAIAKLKKGTRFELITFNATVQSVFGKFASPGGASNKLVDELFEGIAPDDGINTYGALTTALDMGGATAAKAWKRGPDEIVFITCNQPHSGEIKDADVIAAAIGLKGRQRMVRIHTIGIETHPYAMLGRIAKETGGVYRNYYE